MKLIPILFSTPMVQGILSGNKSMTRRTMKLQPGEGEKYEAMGENEFAYISKGGISGPYKCPYGQPGDVLWVRETFEDYKDPECDGSTDDNCICGFTYKAINGTEPVIKWKPSIHMPFEACRIFLRVKEIRVERLIDITRQDAICEGLYKEFDGTSTWYGISETDQLSKDPKMQFARLWIYINGEGSWISNPWVWVIAFERINAKNEIAAIRKQWNERRAK